MGRNRNMRLLVALIAGVIMVTDWMVWHSTTLAQGGLEISKVANRAKVSPGEEVIYTITVTNTSGGLLSNVVITDELPSALEFEEASPTSALVVEGQPLTWHIDSLSVSPTHKITLTVRARKEASGTITNTAFVSANGVPPSCDEAEIYVRPLEQTPTEVRPFISPETPVLSPAVSPTPSPTLPPPAPILTPSSPPDVLPGVLLPVGIGALVLALLIVIVFLLLRLFRGRKKPPVTKPTRPIVSPPALPYLESVGYQGRQQRFPLDKPVIRIGRAEDNDIVITEYFQGWDTVSRVHATIERDGTRYVIVDQGSLNGVYVNGRRTGRNLLKDGWRVAVGAVEFVYHQPPTPS